MVTHLFPSGVGRLIWNNSQEISLICVLVLEHGQLLQICVCFFPRVMIYTKKKVTTNSPRGQTQAFLHIYAIYNILQYHGSFCWYAVRKILNPGWEESQVSYLATFPAAIASRGRRLNMVQECETRRFSSWRWPLKSSQLVLLRSLCSWWSSTVQIRFFHVFPGWYKITLQHADY